LIEPTRCFVRGKEFEDALNGARKLAAELVDRPEDVLARARPVAELTGKKEEDVVREWFYGYIARLEVAAKECAPDLDKALEPVIRDLMHALSEFDRERISRLLEYVEEVQYKVIPRRL